MPIKVLKREGRELRLRMIGEGHTVLQSFRQKLNLMNEVEYANYFPGHPELDDPEFFVRTVEGVDPATLVQELIDGIIDELKGLKL